jgi:signal transduction histidine kinase
MEHSGNTEKHTYLASTDVFKSLRGLLREGVFRCFPSGQLLFSNSTLAAMFGYKSKTALNGISTRSLFADETEATHLTTKILADGQIENARVLFKRLDGANFWGLLNCKKTEFDGQPVLDGTILEINDLRKAEDQLRNEQIRAEKVSAELDKFIYSASHNIRSPITSMKGLINLLKNEKPGDASIGSYMLMLEECLTKLEQYVDELAGFAKTSNQYVVDKVIDPDAFLLTLLKELQNHPNFQRVQATVATTNNGVFSTDPERFRTIIRNVVKNCFDYCDPGKTVKMVTIDFAVKPNKAVIDVFDNGIGIPTSSLDRVFDMFYRATNMSKGAGFGLYIAREAAAKLGGTISLSSEYGVGTSIRIEIPNSKKGKLIHKKKMMRA